MPHRIVESANGAAIVRRVKLPLFAFLIISQTLMFAAHAANSVVNLSHYDLMRVDFEAMRAQGIIGVIHEATYPRNVRDEKYVARQAEATRAGLLWGAYHYANASDPVSQADFFLNTVRSAWNAAAPGSRPSGILLVLDMEQNRHYPGGTMRVDQAVTFIQRIRQRAGVSPGFYSGENRIRAILNGPKVTAAQKAELRSCWLWVANYHKLPSAITPWSSWALWQYTGDGVCDLQPRSQFPKGVANIPRAERNMFHGSPADTRAFWESNAWHPGGPGE